MSGVPSGRLPIEIGFHRAFASPCTCPELRRAPADIAAAHAASWSAVGPHAGGVSRTGAGRSALSSDAGSVAPTSGASADDHGSTTEVPNAFEPKPAPVLPVDGTPTGARADDHGFMTDGPDVADPAAPEPKPAAVHHACADAHGFSSDAAGAGARAAADGCTAFEWKPATLGGKAIGGALHAGNVVDAGAGAGADGPSVDGPAPPRLAADVAAFFARAAAAADCILAVSENGTCIPGAFAFFAATDFEFGDVSFVDAGEFGSPPSSPAAPPAFCVCASLDGAGCCTTFIGASAGTAGPTRSACVASRAKFFAASSIPASIAGGDCSSGASVSIGRKSESFAFFAIFRSVAESARQLRVAQFLCTGDEPQAEWQGGCGDASTAHTVSMPTMQDLASSSTKTQIFELSATEDWIHQLLRRRDEPGCGSRGGN